MTATESPSAGETAAVEVYVGPRPFRTGETLFARDSETASLVNLLIAQRLVLLHAPSGAGKTSLIQAKLVPAMLNRRFDLPMMESKEGHAPQPVILRVNIEPGKCHPPIPNRYAASILSLLEQHRPESRRRSMAELAKYTLDQYLTEEFGASGDPAQEAGDPDLEPSAEQASAAPVSAEKKVRPLLLIFDQFEELLTSDPTDQAVKSDFIHQLNDALRHSGRWALFALREDFLGALEPYISMLPTRLTATYRLDLLRAENAKDAIVKPAKKADVEFEPGLVDRLLKDLCSVSVQQPDGTLERKDGPYIEPVQLQVVCASLWTQKGAVKLITTEHLNALGGDEGTGVDGVLGRYYAESVAKAAKDGCVPERTIRTWFARQLISSRGVRLPVLIAEANSFGVTSSCLAVLDKAFLIRSENRSGAKWYELAHDRLVPPIQVDNDLWRKKHLNTFQLQAELWEERKRPNDLLVTGEILKDGAAWEKANGKDVSPVEAEFLKQCQTELKLAETRRLQSAIVGFVVIGAGLICSWLAVKYYLKSNEVEKQSKVVAAQNLRLIKDEGELTTQKKRADDLFKQISERDVKSLEAEHPNFSSKFTADQQRTSPAIKDEKVPTCDHRWNTGQTLHIRFLNATVESLVLMEIVKTNAQEWTLYANIVFDFNPPDKTDADIRISFDQNPGNWSYLGNTSKDIPLTDATMKIGNLGKVDSKYNRPTVLYLFGHVLGLINENQSPNAPIQWNKEAAHLYFENQGMKKENVDVLLSKYENASTPYRPFDKDSIMMFNIPKQLTLDGVAYTDNFELSKGDKAFAAQLYPYPAPHMLKVDDPELSGILKNNIPSSFKFTIDLQNYYTVRLVGPPGLEMVLFGPNDPYAEIKRNNKSDDAVAYEIKGAFAPGDYYVKVRIAPTFFYNLMQPQNESYQIRVLKQ